MISLYRRAPFLLFLAGMVLFAAWIYVLKLRFTFLPYVDDAFIHLRYARNLANGWGLVWNPGDAPVEGFTSFTYVILLALLAKLGLAQPVISAWVGIASSLLALGLTWELAKELNPGHPWANLFPSALLALERGFQFWAPAGMETPFYTAILAAAALGYVRFRHRKGPAWSVGVLFALAAMTRPEALALFGMTALFELFDRLARRQAIVRHELVAMLAAFAVVFIPYFAWRWSYFGYPFPNTYYAKTGAGLIQVRGGITYLADSLAWIFGGTAAVLPLLLILVPWRKRADELTYLAALTLAAWTVVALDGGDHLALARFVVPTLPLLFVLMGAGFRQLTGDGIQLPRADRRIRVGGPWGTALGIALLLAGAQHWGTLRYAPPNLGPIPKADASSLQTFNRWVPGFIVMGQALAREAPAGSSVAVVPVGAIGYYSDLKVLDMAGIVNPVIAHQPFDPAYVATWRPGHDKGDGAYVLSQRPDYIQLTDRLTSQPSPAPDEHGLQYKSVAEIWASPEFHRLYVFRPLQVEGGWWYNLYRRVTSP